MSLCAFALQREGIQKLHFHSFYNNICNTMIISRLLYCIPDRTNRTFLGILKQPEKNQFNDIRCTKYPLVFAISLGIAKPQVCYSWLARAVRTYVVYAVKLLTVMCLFEGGSDKQMRRKERQGE